MTVQAYERPLVRTGVVNDPADVYFHQMAVAAGEGNEAMFVVAKQQIDWRQRSATDFASAIRWALAAGAHMAARNLAQQGVAQYPDQAELQKFATLLASPKVIVRDLPPTSSIPADREWMLQYSHAYRGRWVALYNGQLLAEATTLKELIEQVGKTEGIFFTKVF